MELTEAIELIKNDYPESRDNPEIWADLGSGNGLFAKALCHYLKAGSKIYAVDKEDFKPDLYTENNCEIIRIKADFEKYVLPVERLNGLLMANSLHYVEDKYSFFHNCLLHYPAGAILIVEYDTDSPVKRWVPYPVSFENLRKMFQSIGHYSVSKIGTHPSLYGKGEIYAALIQK